MKKSDVEYYNDQINSFTPCEAIKKRNSITVVFPDGRKKAAHTEDVAHELYLKCGKGRK